jgi:two-component system, chemotaxis family, sensor kinase CheA
MQIDMKRFHSAFFDEAAEHLAAMEEGLLNLERTPEDRELLHGIFRAAHSIKGASGTFGFEDVAHFTHGLESLLDQLRDGHAATTPELIQLLLQSADTLASLVGAAKDGTPLPPDVDRVLERLDAARGKPRPTDTPAVMSDERPAAPSGAAREYLITFAAGPDLLRHGMDPLLVLRDLGRLGEILEVRLDTSRLPQLEDLVPDECYLGWTVRMRTGAPCDEIQGVFIFVEDGSCISIEEVPPADRPRLPPRSSPNNAGSHKSRALDASSIRVSVEKVDELINLVGELVIAQSMVNQAFGQLASDQLPAMQEAMAAMNRSTRELQDRVMAVRMVPLANVFRRFPRVVHDLAGSLGKQIAVEITGEDTELDKQMIEQLGDPLTHLVRNSVDHGIETPDERVRQGKPAQGVIGLDAFHEGGSVVIEVRDDGRGLDCERIRRKAIAQGLIGPEEQLSDDQVHALIFSPGFSTAEQVTDVSGRGVGMDVVKRNIESLNGSVRVESRPGRGCTFRIRLPLTMAILDGLGVSLNDAIYILPLLSVIESFRPRAGDVKSINGKAEMVIVRGKPVPLVRLHRIFNTQTKVVDPAQGLVVIVENQGKKLGLLVEELLGQMQVVMKSLEANYEKVEGLSGATILGDGQVAFILDVPGLGRLARRTGGISNQERFPESTEEARAAAFEAVPR